MLKFTKQRKTPGITSKKNMAFHEWNKLFAGSFRANLDEKKTLIWSNLQRYGNGNGLPNIKDTFAERLLLQMLVLHLSMYIFKAGLTSSLMAGQNLKRKYLSQIPIKMLKQHAITNLNLHNLKIYSSKGCRKTRQR